jgi:hypothetical protein
MANQISMSVTIIAIVVTAVGTCLLSLLGYFLFTHRHRRKQRANEEEKHVNAALDRAIVSYIAKEDPRAQAPSAPERQGPSPLAMTTAVDANMSGGEGNAAVDSPTLPASCPGPRTPSVDRRGSLWSSDTSVADPSRALRRTTSSHFMDSAERVYANILASPLEQIRARSSPPTAEAVPAVRDDVGWPLPSKKDSWL